MVLCKAKIKLYLKYAPLTCLSSALSHLRRLDAVERGAMRLVQVRERTLPPPLDPLEHCHDVAFLVVFHKVKVQGVSHLDKLRINPRDVDRNTRTVFPVTSLGGFLDFTPASTSAPSNMEHLHGSHFSCNDLSHTGSEAGCPYLARDSPHPTTANGGSGSNVIR